MLSTAEASVPERTWSWQAEWTQPVRRHPITVAVGCASVAVAIVWRLGWSAELPAFVFLSAVGVPLAVIDFKLHRLPDPLTLPAYPIASVLLAAATLFGDADISRLSHAFIGLVALGGVFAAQWFVAPNAIGVGDVKLAGVLGLYLGWLGLAAWVAGVLCMFVSGALWAVTLLASGRAKRDSQIPFGPFMLVGALAGLLLFP
ncbi:prepilin peptidase [Actinomadura sp. 3N407]|uniref:prepilin peptidase n=1 Tax=Actinomadura sp. 3N407 TaxID=3457423 RepID=UPI003FCD7E8B